MWRSLTLLLWALLWAQHIIDTFLHKYYESQQIIDRFNTSCRMADINATVYGGIGDHYLRETAVLNNYFLEVLPSTALTFISWLATKAKGNESGYSCPDRFLCPLFPRRKDVKSGHLKDIMSSCPFILCAREPIKPPAIDIPDQFEAFTCTDGSLIAISLQCDGIPNCPNADDEENCTNVPLQASTVSQIACSLHANAMISITNALVEDSWHSINFVTDNKTAHLEKMRKVV